MKQRAFFLDRDGVLNRSYKHPPNNADELVMIPGVGQAVRKLNELGYRVFVVTNQGGVGLGYFSREALQEIHCKLLQEMEKDGAHIDQIAVCIHKPQSDCSCRKPKPGMITALADQYHIDLSNSYTVGDRDVDIIAGQAAGTKTIYIGSRNHAPEGVDLVSPNLLAAVNTLLAEKLI
ncbi:MAG: HAD family hydrolase [Firmicutes bacterium]|nr:HAD family hydrolase [Bacillota bacterium]